MPHRLIKEVKKLLASDLPASNASECIITDFTIPYSDTVCDQIETILAECNELFQGCTPTPQQRNLLAAHGIEVKHDYQRYRAVLVTQIGQFTLR